MRWQKRHLTGKNLVFLGIGAVYAAVRLALLSGIPPTVHFDSDSYILQYESGFQDGLLGHERPCGYPFLIWITGHRLAFVIWFQRIAAIGGWIFFAHAISRLAASAAGKWIGLIGALAVSLTLTALQWDVSILTESLSLTLLTIQAGLFASMFGQPSPPMRLWLMMAIAGTLFASLRDANNILLPFFVGMIVLSAFRFFRNAENLERRRIIAGGIATSAALAAVFLFHQADIARSGRSWPNIANVLAYRGLVRQGSFGYAYTHAEHLRWFQDHYAIPDQAALRARKTFSDPPPISEEYRSWLKGHGAKAWSHFLFAHPAWALDQYLSHPPHFDDPGTAYLTPQRWPPARLLLPQNLQKIVLFLFFGMLSGPQAQAILLLAMVSSGFLWLAASWSRRLRFAYGYSGTFFFLAGVATLSTGVAVLGDAMETWRHGVTGTVAAFMLLPVSLAAIADGAIGLCKRQRRDSTHATVPPQSVGGAGIEPLDDGACQVG